MERFFKKVAGFFLVVLILIGSSTGFAVSVKTPVKDVQKKVVVSSSKKTKKLASHQTIVKKSSSTGTKITKIKKSKPVTLASSKKSGSSRQQTARHVSRQSKSSSRPKSLELETPDFSAADYENSSTKMLIENASFNGIGNKDLAMLAAETVQGLKQTTYQLGGNQFEPQRGVYRLDCSAYVDKLLQQTNPNAYRTLAQWSKTDKPTTAHYYDFFNWLPSNHWGHWRKIHSVEQLDAGAILVFRYGNKKRKQTGGGHVMIVMNKPVHDPQKPNVFWVNVADSASSGHSGDTRPRRTSGVGIGKLLLKVNPKTKQLDAYAWKAGADWKHNTQFVMALPQSTKRLG